MLNATGDISCCRSDYPETDAEMEFGMKDTYPRSTPVDRRNRSRIGQMEKSSTVRAQQSLT